MPQTKDDRATRQGRHVLVTLPRRTGARSYAVRAWVLYAAFASVPLAILVAVASVLSLVYRDDLVLGVLNREARIVAGYEDRLADLRRELDARASGELLARSAIDAQLRGVMARQASLETRAATVASLAERLRDGTDPAAGGARNKTVVAETKGRTAVQASAAKINPLLQFGASAAARLPATASAFAPVGTSQPAPVRTRDATNDSKPKPESVDITPDDDLAAQRRPALRSDASDPATGQRYGMNMGAPTSTPPAMQLREISRALDDMEGRQADAAVVLADAAHARARQIKAVFAAAGLDASRMMGEAHTVSGAVGGPLVPMKLDPEHSPFDKQLALLQDDLAASDRLIRTLPYVPLAQPISGALEITSPFGGRSDPFTGRLMMHTGLDLRQDYGSPVTSTAAGKVTVAGPAGGYGNMVEIDHGNGLVTRYGHLSAIVVSENQTVAAGEPIGRAGSTGRSTGTHLHYEVRVDGEPVDPLRFLRAGERLVAAN